MKYKLYIKNETEAGSLINSAEESNEFTIIFLNDGNKSAFKEIFFFFFEINE